ncbi:pilus assembly protein PilY [Acinetobacter towneri]
MKKQTYKLAVVSGLKNMNLRPLAVACMSFMGTCVLTASVAQASDLQIYATPEAGQKTIVMMLDTSGSMGDSDRGQTGSRLYRLKQGMYKLLDSTDSNLPETKVGLGRFWASGNYDGGKILVEAEKLGKVGSAHREKLRTAVKNLSADDWTPTAQAYAEAAAYLLGTNTIKRAIIAVDKYKTETKSEIVNYKCENSTYPYLNSNQTRCYQYNRYGFLSGNWEAPTAKYENVTRRYECTALNNTNFTTEIQTCKTWTEKSSIPSTYTADGTRDITDGVLYYSNQVQTDGDSNYSGFTKVSVGNIRDELNYKSPLPEVAKRQSCDGQGIYVLSDGEANRSGSTKVLPLMQQALNDTSFKCPTNGLTNLNSGNGDSAWHCMGEFAKYLFDKTKNPSGVSIQTAFVGFGNDFNGLDKAHVQQACKLSSRTQDDRRSDDSCSPTANTTHKLTKPGYGNGGFFETQSEQGVTDSVIQFIKNLGDTQIEPLSTGAISVPVDALNPNGFQPYGYLRALSPNPGQPVSIWIGNLKKYDINNGALVDGSKTIFNEVGKFDLTTKDLWNPTSVADGGMVNQGGVFWNLPMPTQAVSAVNANPDLNIRAVPAITANPNGLRNLYTDVSKVENNQLISKTSGELLKIPDVASGTVTSGANVLDKFKNQDELKSFSLEIKHRLLNYLGYDLGESIATGLPTTLPVPTKPFVSLGGSIHSYPLQLTYSGEINANGDLTSVRKQSVIFGSMEGGLHIVDAKTGVEQSVFVPAEILKNPEAAKALRAGQAGDIQHGISGAWISDTAYEMKRGTSTTSSAVTAKKMNVYGGMRMGGNSYYALDLLNENKPKLLFRVGNDLANYTRMGQTWSKPVLANIRYNNKIRRVMIVGGGYDMCYEDPRFRLGQNNTSDFGGSSCKKSEALGNAVYIIDAETGERIWWTSNTGSNKDNTDLKHSVTTRISTLDRDGDNLVDHLYFGDLGGQVFRIDLNNKKDTPAASFGHNVIRLANLATTDSGVAITNGDAPRFYQPPTITIHDEGSETFILVAIASGDRSTPLDVAPSKGRESIKPFDPLQNRPTNKVYGLIDRDFVERDLFKSTYTTFKSKDITLNQLQKNPQTLPSFTAVKNTFFGGSSKHGWYRSLSSDYLGNEVASRTPGGVKAFEEEPIAIKNNLFVPVYDPEGTGVEDADPCQPRIVGESNRQQYCLPFGVCLKNGLKDTDSEKRTGMIIEDGKNKNVLGAGIRGITLGPVGGGSGSGSGGPNTNSCGTLTLIGNLQGAGEWECLRVLNPVRWYEKNVAP